MTWLRSQLRVTWHLPAVLAVLAIVLLSVAATPWLTSMPPRVVHLRGSHREIGLQHGRLLHDEIRALYDAYVVHGLVEKEQQSLASLTRTARHYDRFIPGPLREELHGIADGAGVPYDQILVMNTFADALLGRSPRFCSAVAVHGNAGLLVGRNLDWVNHGVAHRSGVVFIGPSDGVVTIQSVVFDPKARAAHVAIGKLPAPAGRFYRIAL
ncbi:MAG: peptidase acyl-coenzyme A:6-aminopenicillanic acid acyl-transferase [Acidobacteria bacterium]|nr:peptidase acyl-coenzyme A:6-aminopenicillanic acid acyl-transferase [Acidobacteriota bacterium]